MFKQPQPVPSVAAIRALRGLIFGTSCTFALVAEDRRRRINAARTVLRNAERLKSDKRYYAGGAAAVAAVQDKALFDAAVIEGLNHDGPLPTARHPSHPSRRRLEEALGANRTTVARKPADDSGPSLTETEEGRDGQPLSHRDAFKPSSPATARFDISRQPLSERHLSLLPANSIPRPEKQSSPEGAQFSQREDMRRHEPVVMRPTIYRSIISRSRTRGLGEDIERLRGAIDGCDEPMGPQAELIAASASLCRRCQRLGSMDEAAAVLRLAVKKLQMDETSYLAHQPLPVIEYLLPPVTCDYGGSETAEAPNVEEPRSPIAPTLRRHASFVETLDKAEALFLPDSVGSWKGQHQGIPEMGEKLLERAFNAGSMHHIRSVFVKLMKGNCGSGAIPPWYFSRLEEMRSFPWITRSFLMLPDGEYHALKRRLCDTVVDAVKASHGLLAAAVLRWLAAQVSDTFRIYTAHVTELLYQYWKRKRDFQDTAALFTEVLEDDITNKVSHVDAPFRVMVQIALEAGEVAAAEDYARKLVSLVPKTAYDIRIQGTLAQAKARNGDWEGVRETFQQVLTDKTSLHRAGRVLMPILKEYARTHSTRETEEWLQDYIDNLGVPICREMVTFMGKAYGHERDPESFVAWLDHCVKSGLVVDAAFSNTILQTCHKNWRFQFERLGILYKKLCLLSPNFEDEYTRRIMANSALTKRAVVARSGYVRLKWLGVGVDKSAMQGRSGHEEDVFLAMKAVSRRVGPQRAAWLYEQALKRGMPPSEKCLKLMVALSTVQGGSGKVAPRLLSQASARGDAVDAATAHLVIRELNRLETDWLHREDLFREIQAAIRPFETAGTKLNDKVLNMAARLLFFRRDVHNAMQLGLLAADVAGQPPGYNLDNFNVLLWSFSLQMDAEKVEEVIQGFTHGADVRWGYCILSLRKANRMILKLADGAAKHRVLVAVRRALRTAEREWAAYETTCSWLEQECVKLMSNSALSAGNEPVDFDKLEMHWEESPMRSELLAEVAADEEEILAAEEAGWDREDEKQGIESGVQ